MGGLVAVGEDVGELTSRLGLGHTWRTTKDEGQPKDRNPVRHTHAKAVGAWTNGFLIAAAAAVAATVVHGQQPAPPPSGGRPTAAAGSEGRAPSTTNTTRTSKHESFNVPGFPVAVHAVIMVPLGMHMLDNLDLEALAETAAKLKRWEFMFIAAPTPAAHDTGSQINPIAIF